MSLVPASRIFHHVTSCPTTVLEVLETHFKVSSERAQELIELGSLYLNKKRVFRNETLPKGAYLRLHLYPKRYEVREIEWKKKVIFESSDFLVMNKPAGVPTHASVDNALENCLEQTRKALKKTLLVTQRLDVPVGGLLVFAKNKKAQARFNQWLVDKKVKKIYEALVESPCPLGLHRHYMEPSARAPKIISSEIKPHWLTCELTIHTCTEIKTEEKTLYQLRIELHTGRTHQIRAQLAFLGAPILGDKQYGSKIKSLEKDTIALVAVGLQWPGGEVFL